MKYVLEASVAAKWYLHDPFFVKAMQLRSGFHTGRHELLAPDTLPADCGAILTTAERQGILDPGEAVRDARDLALVRIQLHPSLPLLERASVIALETRLTIYHSLYVALAERESCELLTADQKLLRKIRKKFTFVVDFASLP
jgi:predicted nucleic acid-binding protein